MKPNGTHAPHNFGRSLARSHAVQDYDFWFEVYPAAFPTVQFIPPHPKPGVHQVQGVDRSLICEDSTQILIDEKVRGRNKKTGRVYSDIALEYLGDEVKGYPGWVCKPLRCHYIAYVIAPLGVAYMLPVVQLQAAWKLHGALWIREAEQGMNGRRIIRAHNMHDGEEWDTLSVPIKPDELKAVVSGMIICNFTPTELGD